MQEQSENLEQVFVEFQGSMNEIYTWLDKSEGVLKQSSRLPLEQQGSDEEIEKYKVRPTASKCSFLRLLTTPLEEMNAF